MFKDIRNVVLSFGIVGITALVGSHGYGEQQKVIAEAAAKMQLEEQIRNRKLAELQRKKIQIRTAQEATTASLVPTTSPTTTKTAANDALIAERKRQAMLQQAAQQKAAQDAAAALAAQQAADAAALANAQMMARLSRAS